MRLNLCFCRPALTFLCLHLSFAFTHAAEGLKAEFYNDYKVVNGVIVLDGLTLVKSETDTNLDHWTGESTYDWSPVGGGNYTVRWTGALFAPETGRYGIGTISDDGSQAWIDGQMVLNNGEGQWYDWQEASVTLDAGYHSFELRFYDSAVYSGIELWWLLPSQGSSSLPYSGDNFHGAPPTLNADSKWQTISTEFLTTEPPVPFPTLTSHFNSLTQDVELQWMSAVDANYELFVSEDLKTWQSIEGEIQGTGGLLSRSRTLGKIAEFFRLAATPTQ